MRDSLAAISELSGPDGRFFSRVNPTVWTRPGRVELSSDASEIHFLDLGLGSSEDTEGSRSIRPPADLLERFLKLRTALAPQLCRFVERFGGLEVFESVKVEPMCRVEYCDVWRYFAGAMEALLRIAANLYSGGRGKTEDWATVADLPPSMTRAKQDRPRAFFDGEYLWLLAAEPFDPRRVLPGVKVIEPTPRERLISLVNALLELGRVRPSIVWPARRRSPEVIHTSRSLLSYLAFQLCLRVAKVDAYVVCFHCHAEYWSERAPKSGQRHFCPTCREKGIPGHYASAAYREKMRAKRKKGSVTPR